MIAAVLIERSKTVLPDGAIVEIVVWKVPEPIPGSTHLFKYRLFYGKDGRRVVGFDNERGKGDHRHLDGAEHPYSFTTNRYPPIRFSEGNNQEEAETMREALIQIRADSEAALDEAFVRATNAMRSGNSSEPVAGFTFSSPAQLFSVISPKR